MHSRGLLPAFLLVLLVLTMGLVAGCGGEQSGRAVARNADSTVWNADLRRGQGGVRLRNADSGLCNIEMRRGILRCGVEYRRAVQSDRSEVQSARNEGAEY